MTVLQDNPELVLRSVNRRLCELLHEQPLQLAEGGAKSIADPLWVWGILGGKEVGKTTLINALAGAEVVPPGVEVGQGTYQPAAYLSPDDVSALQARFAGLGSMAVSYHADASEAMRGVVLVDLPDFDSLFTDHVDQVRRMATVLDGIIWVTTPKKLGDLRAINEIQQVLKARSNFVYAVNKIDWLLGQTDGPVQQELDRVFAALQRQVAECDPTGGRERAFLVSAKYRDARAILDAIARQRAPAEDRESVSAGNGALAKAADRVLRDFEALRKALTTAPTAEASLANKRANLAFQVHRQATQLLEHYQPRRVLERLERAADPQAINQSVGRSFHPAYCAQVFERLNSGRGLFAEWSTSLFKARIAHWPLLGIIAWPVALAGMVFSGLRFALGPLAGGGDSSAGGRGDPFRAEGLSVDQRADAVRDRVRAELAPVSHRVTIELPQAAALVQQFRAEAETLARDRRSAVIDPLLRKRPSLPGRLGRSIIPLAVLLWFPLVQPVLAAMLGTFGGQVRFDAAAAAALVDALSARQVLSGLIAALLIMAALVAAVYSRAVRDTYIALERLQTAGPEILADSLLDSLANTIRRPIEQTRSTLSEATNTLEHLAGAGPAG